MNENVFWAHVFGHMFVGIYDSITQDQDQFIAGILMSSLSFCRYTEEEESSGSKFSGSATACTSPSAKRELSDGPDAPLSSALCLGSS